MSRLIQCNAFTRQKLSNDFASLKYACPPGVYVAPVPDEPLLWTGVLFVSKGPYANAVLRFEITFSHDFPDQAPVVTFTSDVFHPLVTPLTTYTYTGQDSGVETVSAGDQVRLPPGGVSLRHGFPEWFPDTESGAATPALARGWEHDEKDDGTGDAQKGTAGTNGKGHFQPNHSQETQQRPHVVEVLQYLRVIMSSEAVLDSVPLDVAANSGAWHAWKSYRSKPGGASMSSARKQIGSPMERSSSPRQQPGGARRPGDWNWQGVWEDRVRKNVQASLTEQALYGGSESDAISFLKMDRESVQAISAPLTQDATA